ncbi:MAG TPA: hypothetical protein VGP26_29000 [Actinophytocola sp.]|jgi:hypothetical protein|nr:hypothetical protein [Actinophytocola sp.]
MNEQELRQAMRATMATVPTPPPMSENPVLDAARRVERRRRARWAGVGSAAAAVAVIGVAVVVVMVTSGAGGNQAAGPGTSPATTSSTTTTNTTTTSAATADTDPSWPNGQTDRTAHNGPEYDMGAALLTELDAVVPAGYESPDGLKGTGELAGAPMKHHQAQYVDTVDGTEVWEYSADAVVTKGGGYGRLIAEVNTPGNEMTGDGCALKPGLWGMTGTCTEVVVDGKRVGVFTSKDHETDQFDQWAGYRYDDGTVVFIGLADHRAFTNFPPLAGPPLTTQRLAELAADPGFRLG